MKFSTRPETWTMPYKKLLALALFFVPCQGLAHSTHTDSVHISVSLLPPAGWKTAGGVVLREDGRIYVTSGKDGFIYRSCSANLSAYPYLMVRMNDSIHGSLLALWLSGSVSNWGVEPENWYWFEAGFAEQNTQKWFKEGSPAKMPSSFYGQMLLLGIASGATVYVLEPPSAVWEAPGRLGPNWENNLYPLMKKMLEDEIIPARETVWSLVRHAVALNKEIPWRADYGSELQKFYQQVYHPRSLFDVLPKTNNYFVPIFTPQTLKASMELLSGFETRKGAQLIALMRTVTENNTTSGSALIVQNKDTYFVMTNRENHADKQNFFIRLAGEFRSLRGQLETNEYLVAKQHSLADLRLQLNVRPGRSPASLQVDFSRLPTSHPIVSMVAGRREISTKWDGKDRVLTVAFDRALEGSFEILISAR